MSKLVFNSRRTPEEIRENHHTYETGISEAYAKELPNIIHQISLNNDNYIRAQVNAARYMIKQDGSYQKLDNNSEAKKFIDGVCRRMPTNDADLKISLSALQRLLQGCMEVPEPVWVDYQNIHKEAGTVYSTKMQNVKLNLPFLLSTLTNALNFQKGIEQRHIFWIVMAILSQYVDLKQQMDVAFSEDEAAVVCQLYEKYNGCASIDEEQFVECIKEKIASGELTLNADINEILTKLDRYRCISLNSGTIELIEKFDL